MVSGAQEEKAFYPRWSMTAQTKTRPLEWRLETTTSKVTYPPVEQRRLQQELFYTTHTQVNKGRTTALPAAESRDYQLNHRPRERFLARWVGRLRAFYGRISGPEITEHHRTASAVCMARHDWSRYW